MPRGFPSHQPPMQQRYWSKVEKKGPDECWEWTGYRDKNGYGRIQKTGGNGIPAHRYAYEIHHGAIPAGLIIRHSCDNPPCQNPRHLLLGTHADNARDKVERKRTRTGDNSPRRLHPEKFPCGEKVRCAKLTEQEVLFIRQSTIPKRKICKLFGVSYNLIKLIRQKRIWKHLIEKPAIDNQYEKESGGS